MFDHDADKRRGAGLTAFNPLAVSKAMPEPRPLPSFEMLDRLERMLREERIRNIIWPPVFLPAPIEAPGATGCLSSPEYPKGMNGPTGGAPHQERKAPRNMTRGTWPPSNVNPSSLPAELKAWINNPPDWVWNAPREMLPTLDLVLLVYNGGWEGRRGLEIVEIFVRSELRAALELAGISNPPASINPDNITYTNEGQGKSGFWPLFEIDPEKVKTING